MTFTKKKKLKKILNLLGFRVSKNCVRVLKGISMTSCRVHVTSRKYKRDIKEWEQCSPHGKVITKKFRKIKFPVFKSKY